MINAKDVVKIKMPYPSIRSDLAVTAHMYICKSNNGKYELVKCQTYKPTITYLRHYVDENADITRNPFIKKTKIDCDKLFALNDVVLDDTLKTSRRPDVCDDLFNSVISELTADGYTVVSPDTNILIGLNPLIMRK